MEEKLQADKMNLTQNFGVKYQQEQADKYRNRATNHWKNRIDLAYMLFNNYAVPEFSDTRPENIRILDIGCSIGTFAIEFAKLGYSSFGIDSDAAALEIAKELCNEENTSAQFIHMDIARWKNNAVKPVDVAICFDIFEHLQDDELGRFLYHIENLLTEKGMLIFHTYPTLYYFIFQTQAKGISLYSPLRLFRKVPPSLFERIVKIYSHIIDIALIVRYGHTLREKIQKYPHNNLFSNKRLLELLTRAGFDVAFIESDNLYPVDTEIKSLFRKHEIANMNLYGVAKKRKSRPHK